MPKRRPAADQAAGHSELSRRAYEILRRGDASTGTILTTGCRQERELNSARMIPVFLYGARRWMFELHPTVAGRRRAAR